MLTPYWIRWLRADIPPSDLPYGVVMASGGAAQAASLCGLDVLAGLLTGLAVLQALLIPIQALRIPGRVALPQWRFGLFTIVLGWAVLAGDLQALSPVAARVALAFAWSATLVLGSGRLLLLRRPTGRHEPVDGTWFLAPAALLGDALATATVVDNHSSWVLWSIAGVSLVGVAGYLLVIALSAQRLRRQGLSGAPLAPWWIAAGCGGLAAAATGTIANNMTGNLPGRILDGLTATTWLLGTLLLIAVLAGCARYAWRRQPGPWLHVWTPVFSMAVYATGTDRLAQLSPLAWPGGLTAAAVATTLALWAINSALCLRRPSQGWRHRL